MKSTRSRLDRLISKELSISLKQVKWAVAQQRVRVNGELAVDVNTQVDEFSVIEFDGDILQNKVPIYIMFNKPVGCVCATQDNQHKTVIDLIDHPQKQSLHIAGRLDLNSSGLVLLTNDGRWSRNLSLPEKKVTKAYRVTVANALTEDYIAAFETGMYFEYEGITTKPVQLTIVSEYIAELVLTEGKYHQIKRMFGRFRNPVLALHRYRIGGLTLDDSLPEGAYQELTLKQLIALQP